MKHQRRRFLQLAAGAAALAIILLQGVTTEAAEVRVLSTGALTIVTNELYAQFERSTGHKLAVRYGFGPVLSREIETGATFDVAILSLDVEGLIKHGKIAAGTRSVLGRSGIGVGVRNGAPKPDISTTEALKRSLLNVKSVAYSVEGSSGLYFVGLLGRLGIAEDMKTKLRPQPPGSNAAQAVVTGEAEMAIVAVALVLMVPEAELVGWLPSEVQNYVLFTGGVSATAEQPEAAKALLDFLIAPETRAILMAKGLEPVMP
jgi:molybdate transport system substrate-binding protein